MPRKRRAGDVRRRRWTEADARSTLASLEASGLSVAAFAAREGLSAQRLHRWRHRLAENDVAAPAFIEIPRQVVGVVEVVLRSGRVLRVSESIDGAVLRRIAASLEDTAGC
jgi:transposase-like protein